MKCSSCQAEVTTAVYCPMCGATTENAGSQFADAERRLAELKAQREAGQISGSDFQLAVQQLTVQDAAGQTWWLGGEPGQWHRHDGQNWVKESLPRQPAPALASTPGLSTPAPVTQKAKQTSPKRSNIVKAGCGVGGLIAIITILFIAAAGALNIFYESFSNNEPLFGGSSNDDDHFDYSQPVGIGDDVVDAGADIADQSGAVADAVVAADEETDVTAADGNSDDEGSTEPNDEEGGDNSGDELDTGDELEPAANPPEPEGTRVVQERYKDTLSGVSLSHPSNWVINEVGGEEDRRREVWLRRFGEEDKISAWVSVIPMDTAIMSGTTPLEALDFALDDVYFGPDGSYQITTVEEPREQQISGQSAARMVVRIDREESDVATMMDLAVIRGSDRAAIIKGTWGESDPEYGGLVRDIGDSVELEPPTPP